MAKKTEQIDKWANVFGKEYTDRNLYNPQELDEFYKKTWGATRTELNEEFLSFLDKDKTKILEVGSNVGNQLLSLQSMGFKNLYGIEISKYAVEKSKERTKDINIICGSAFDLPFKDEYFDIIASSQLIYCISKNKRPSVFQELDRILKKEGKIIFFETKSFLNWNIDEVKNFFENRGYKIKIIQSSEFKTCCILFGEK